MRPIGQCDPTTQRMLDGLQRTTEQSHEQEMADKNRPVIIAALIIELSVVLVAVAAFCYYMKRLKAEAKHRDVEEGEISVTLWPEKRAVPIPREPEKREWTRML